MVVGEASIHNIMGGMESTGGVRLHNHKRKLKQRFDIIKKLGQGTYGKVQLGINKETGQEVAIKTIKKCKIDTEADLIRIRREIQIMSSVQHPNIIHIYEVFENREKMVLVMEYAAGGELYDYLSERKVLAEQEARRIFRQISTAVFYCHKHKICHRDLKLENILLDQAGNAKIADFGLSNVFDEQRLLNTFCGSPLYASPEIVKGTPYHGPEVDCWSLGVLLYTLVYGAMPFDGSNFKRLVKQISQSDYFEPHKPSPASPLIKEMLTVCPSRRADIEKICTHWWVNEGYEQNCLDIAEDLAAQTPVRLDLLLSLVPQSASADKLVVGDQQPTSADITNSISSETLVPTRCHSVGSLMELDQNNTDRRIREMVEEEPAAAAVAAASTTGDAKRKLETTPSMDETIAAGIKRKERTRRKDGTEDRDPRAYRSASKHHSAPIPNSIILEEAMEVDPAVVVSVPTTKTVDINKVEDSASCLELKQQDMKEKSPSKERSKTPVVPDQPQNLVEDIAMSNAKDQRVEENKNEVVAEPSKSNEEIRQPHYSASTLASPEKTVAQAFAGEKKEVSKFEVPKEKSPVKTSDTASSNDPAQKDNEKAAESDPPQLKETKKLRNKALSLDSELLAEESAPKPSTERRRSKIFETAEKFNQLASPVEPEKPKKIFIPGVNVGGAKLAFERKASLSSATLPQTIKVAPVSKVIIDVPTVDKKTENEKSVELDAKEREKKREEEKKRAVDTITAALGKPPMQRKSNGSPPISPQSSDPKKLGLKIPLGPNDIRNATITVSTPTETKFPFESKSELQAKATPGTPGATNHDTSNFTTEEPKKCSKMEITLKSATLPRPRKTSKAEITLSGVRPVDTAFRSEVEAKIDAFRPQKLSTQRSEILPVATIIPQAHRSASLEPEGHVNRGSFKERIIPIQVEPIPQQATVHSTTPPPKPPMPQRSMSQRSGSLSRQSTIDSDTDSALGSTVGPEPIRKSPREYIIPIAVEGGGYVTPRSGSVEPESKNSTPTSTNPPRSRFGRPRRMGSLLSDASEDESPFSSLHRDNDDLLQRHMHRLRSSRPTRKAPEHADSLSSGEDDDDDGFELLTAENLFSTLLSRVRSLTQRLNVDDNRGTSFPSSRLLGRLGSNSPQGFWGMHEPLSRRISENQFRHSMSRDSNDRFSRKETSGPNSGQNSPGARTPSRDSLFDMGNNTLPRAKSQRSSEQRTSPAPEGLDQSLTPGLARRLSRQFIEQTRQPLPRSPSLPRERGLRCSPARDLDRLRSRSHDRSFAVGLRRASSLLEAPLSHARERRSPRRSISLFDDEDRYLPPLGPRKLSVAPIAIVDKIQEEPPEEAQPQQPRVPLIRTDDLEPSSLSEGLERTSSRSLVSDETSPADSTSNILDYGPTYKSSSGSTRDLANRLLAAENLIKESKLKNLGMSRYSPNLSANYREFDKCDKEALGALSESASAAVAKRRSCIPSLRLRSGSLTRDGSLGRSNSLSTASQPSEEPPPAERSLLSKFFRSASGSREPEPRDRSADPPRQRRISRFLRPDFFDTPREESQYVKEREAQKAAENERRKSRFMRRKAEASEERLDKELKNEVNSLTKSAKEPEQEEGKSPAPGRSSFLQTLERKLERFRSGEDTSRAPTPAVEDNRAQEAAPAQLRREPSEEELSTVESSSASAPAPAKSKVNSVLGLFKSSESNGAPRSQGQTILGRLRKSAYKGSRSDSVLSADPTTSKIPTKASKQPASAEGSRSPEKSTFGFKRSPSKDKDKESTPPKRISPETKKPTVEKLSRTLKKSPEKSSKGSKAEKTEKISEGKREGSIDKKKSAEKMVIKKNGSPDKCKSPERIVDNKQIEDMNGDAEEKLSTSKLKKKVVTSNSLSENSSSTKSDKSDGVKKVKKVVKSKDKEAANKDKDKDAGESTKKKRIVRVVRKVVKKSSDNPESKTEEKDKPVKTTVKKSLLQKKEKGPELSAPSVLQRKSPENQNSVRSESAIESKVDEDVVESASQIDTEEKSNSESRKIQFPKIANSIVPPKTTEAKPSRDKLKLDFSKIPQHNFRNVTPPRRESPKSETPRSEVSDIPKLVQRSQSAEVSERLTDGLSRIMQRASIAGSKIIMDKPPKGKESTEAPRISPTIAKSRNSVEKSVSTSNDFEKENHVRPISTHSPLEVEKNSIEATKERKVSSCSLREPTTTEELLSPAEDTESFDSWSICSADINHTRGDLHSPTSPTYSMYLRGEHPPTESVIDRIRRKSFYSRFNDRKRKASLNAPPPGVNMSSSMTLPRKFSFHSSRDSASGKEQPSKARNYTMPSRKRDSEKCYSMYNEDTPYLRKSPIERDRYSDGGSASSFANDFKIAGESYGHISSSYEPLRKYLSPTFDPSVARRKYHSTEFNSDNDLGSYRNSSLTDSMLEPGLGRNVSLLPRRYGSSVSGFEPKTIEYYEELLAPNNTDYLGGRRASPLPHENYKLENGYHNGSIDLPQFSADKWKSDKALKTDLSEGMLAEARTRKASQCISEPDDVSTTSTAE